MNKSYFEIGKAQEVQLSHFPSLGKSLYDSEEDYRAQLDEDHEALEEYQTLLYAGQNKGLLLIFQGMDTAGKDGAIRHVMGGVNPQGCEVTSFKTPSARELQHDFLWRAAAALPERGKIGIFNRSYYE